MQPSSCDQSSMTDITCERIEFIVLQLVAGLRSCPRQVSLTVPEDAHKTRKQILSFRNARTRRALCCVVRVLALLYQRASKSGRGTMTKRAVFYADKALFRDQRQSDKALERASLILGLDRTVLRVLASPRGFVAGDLALEFDDGSVLQCSDDDTSNCSERPVREGWQVVRMRSNAQCVVVIEKYSFFHDFVHNPLVRESLPSCIFMTSCGFPVRAVTDLLSLVCTVLCLPCFVLVDFDPYGIDIFLKYRQVVPSAVLAALHAEDIAFVPQKCALPLSPADAARGANLLPVAEDADCVAALRLMMQSKLKLELEAVHQSDELLKRVIKRIEKLVVGDMHQKGALISYHRA